MRSTSEYQLKVTVYEGVGTLAQNFR